jgi:hypothetical protein
VLKLDRRGALNLELMPSMVLPAIKPPAPLLPGFHRLSTPRTLSGAIAHLQSIAKATSHTSFDRTHWIFSGIFGGFSTVGLSVKSGLTVASFLSFLFH